MSTDLSKIIQDGLSSTLTSLLGKESSLNETTKVDLRDLNHSDFLQVNSEFAFEQLTTLLEFYIPAASASIIFNTMMSAEDYDIASTIDDDTSDAMSEFVSNLSGGLVTAFNAENIEDLGSVKFNIQHKEILKGSELTNIETLFRFSVNIEETPVLIFIRFHEEFLPFIPNIAQSEPTFYPQQEEPQELNEEDTKEEKQEEKFQNIDSKEEIRELLSDEDTNEEHSQSKIKKLFTKKNKIIIATLVTILIIVIITFSLIGSKEEKVQEEETQKQVSEQPPKKENNKQIETTAYTTLKKIDFSIKDIDVNRLNNRLSTLTKFQVLSEKELKGQELEEKIRLEKLQKEQELIAFAQQNKEEPIKTPQENEKNSTKKITEEGEKELPSSSVQNGTTEQKRQESTIQNETRVADIEFYYLSTYSIKYNLYKNLITENSTPNVRISICNDKEGRTSVFIGPFETDIAQMKMKTMIEKADSSIDTTLLKMTKELFDQQCNF